MQYKADSLSVLRNHDLIINNTLQPGVSLILARWPDRTLFRYGWPQKVSFTFCVTLRAPSPKRSSRLRYGSWRHVGGGMAAETIRVILFNSRLIWLLFKWLLKLFFESHCLVIVFQIIVIIVIVAVWLSISGCAGEPLRGLLLQITKLINPCTA